MRRNKEETEDIIDAALIRVLVMVFAWLFAIGVTIGVVVGLVVDIFDLLKGKLNVR